MLWQWGIYLVAFPLSLSLCPPLSVIIFKHYNKPLPHHVTKLSKFNPQFFSQLVSWSDLEMADHESQAKFGVTNLQSHGKQVTRRPGLFKRPFLRQYFKKQEDGTFALVRESAAHKVTWNVRELKLFHPLSSNTQTNKHSQEFNRYSLPSHTIPIPKLHHLLLTGALL